MGASGDLAPLAHLALGLLGEGRMWSPLTGWDDAALVLKKNNLEVYLKSVLSQDLRIFDAHNFLIVFFRKWI